MLYAPSRLVHSMLLPAAFFMVLSLIVAKFSKINITTHWPECPEYFARAIKWYNQIYKSER